MKVVAKWVRYEKEHKTNRTAVALCAKSSSHSVKSMYGVRNDITAASHLFQNTEENLRS